MEKYFDLFLSFIVSPKETIQQIKQNDYIKFGIIVFILSILCFAVQNVLVFNESFVFVFLLEVFFISIFLIFFISWVHFVSSFFSKENNIKTILTVFLMCFSPLFFSFPLVVIFTTWLPAGFFWYLTINFFTFMWILSLFVMSIKNIYLLNRKQTFFVIFSPLILLGLIAIIFSLIPIF